MRALLMTSPHRIRRYTHMANMTGLSPSTRYYYKVHSAAGNESSAIFSFKTQPTAATLDPNLPELHLIYGDMGARDAFTLCSTCTGHSLVCDKATCAAANQSAGLISEIAKSNHIVHVGDFAYVEEPTPLSNLESARGPLSARSLIAGRSLLSAEVRAPPDDVIVFEKVQPAGRRGHCG